MKEAKSSRREFLTASAAGVLGLASGAMNLLEGEELQPAGELLYVGTYTENDADDGVHLVRMNPRSGALRLIGSVKAGANPSFLTIHPKGGVLYAVNEVTERGGKPTGGVTAFGIARNTGALTRLNEQASGGGAPCYASVDGSGRALLVANYVGGNVALLPIRAGGGLGPATHVAQHTGTGPDKARQEAPHAHCILPDRSNRFALAADLGIDRVLVYRMHPDTGTLVHVEGSDAQMRPGAGPRHLAFHPRLPLVFVANELDSTLTTLRFNPESGALTTLRTDSTLPPGWTGTSYVADIHLSPSGRTLYVSNRGHNSIAVFSVAASTGVVALEQVIPTGGDWPRNFSLDPTGSWLLVANQRSGSVTVFRRNPRNGQLTATSQQIALPRPVCLRFRSRVD